MAYFRIFCAGWLLALLLGRPATAGAGSRGPGGDESDRFALWRTVPTRGSYLSAGWQLGRWANHGMGGMEYQALRINRGANTASVQEPLLWTQTFGGPTFSITSLGSLGSIGLRWTNRHTRRAGRWTDLAGQEWRTEYRVRLNELSVAYSVNLWGGRLRPGVSTDIGLLRISQRTGPGTETGKWVPLHGASGFLSKGGITPVAALTLFCDLTYLLTDRLGFVVQPYYQHHLIAVDYFSLYGTRDLRSFRYGVHNLGIAASAIIVLGQ